MRKLTTKLLVSILSVTLALAALGTSTFAWFTLGDSATVSNITTNVKAQKGIEVSLDYNAQNPTAATWTNDITPAVWNGTLKDLANVLSSTSDLSLMKTDALAAVAGTDYYELPIYVRALGAAQDEKLQVVVTITSANMQAWTQDVTFTANQKEYVDPDLEAGSEEGQLDHASNISYQYGATAMTAGSTWTPNAGQAARVTLVSTNTTTFADTTNKFTGETSDAIVTKANNLARDYAHAKNFQLANTWAATNIETGQVTAFGAQPVDVNGNVKMDDDIILITLNIWLNGWDDQCINAILGGSFEIDITFSTAALSA